MNGKWYDNRSENTLFFFSWRAALYPFPTFRVAPERFEIGGNWGEKCGGEALWIMGVRSMGICEIVGDMYRRHWLPSDPDIDAVFLCTWSGENGIREGRFPLWGKSEASCVGHFVGVSGWNNTQAFKPQANQTIFSRLKFSDHSMKRQIQYRGRRCR